MTLLVGIAIGLLLGIASCTVISMVIFRGSPEERKERFEAWKKRMAEAERRHWYTIPPLDRY